MQDETEVHMGTYKFTQKYCIGQGSFGKVYKGVNKATGQFVAIKEIDSALLSQKQIITEINILKGLKHINIVHYEDAFQNNGLFYIVTEYCNGGDLRSLMEDMYELQQSKQVQTVMRMFQQVCEGFNYLRSFNIIHRDLKPSNLLLHNNTYKISDFGLAKQQSVYRSIMNQQLVGVPIYISPQILSKNYYTYKCDVWSLGVIVFEMYFEDLPWKAQDVDDLFFQIMNNLEPYRNLDRKIPYSILNILENTLKYLEKDRMNWQGLLTLQLTSTQKEKERKKIFGIDFTKSTQRCKYENQNFDSSGTGNNINPYISKHQVEIINHIYGQAQSLQHELVKLTNQQKYSTLLMKINHYLREGPNKQQQFLDCCLVFMKIVGNNLHLQLIRSLLVLLQLLNDFINKHSNPNGLKKQVRNSKRNQQIQNYAAQVINKINTLIY